MRPALTAEPPFDDEPTAGFPVPTGPIPAPPAPILDARAQHAAPAHAGPPGPAAARYVQVCLEVLNGFRPASHLRTLTGSVEFGEILRQLRLRRNAEARASYLGGAEPVHGTTPGPVVRAVPRPGSSGNLGRVGAMLGVRDGAGVANAGRFGTSAGPTNTACTASAFRLRRLRVAEPVAGIAEVVAVLSHAGRSLALAMRLEARGSAWVCTVVQVV